MQRQTWSSTLTYILTVAGATIGFGATWRFPYLVGENGGGAYVLVFCIAMIIIGIPVILVENVIGRKAMTNSVDAFKQKMAKHWIYGTFRKFWYNGLLHGAWRMGFSLYLGINARKF
ncbi:LOW QUALITY PROTEIN: putative neurotransmitter:Na+ symporter protein [Campylobacter jejuni subsp. jejuni 414]|nr:LOW QUALITY PROTEIN: putative neurotransmitter:Na+ symporter protein [Campylobacter jejuni subsp. jejuni 414]